MGARFFDPELRAYTGPWPPYPGLYPVHVRDLGFVLELSVWDQEVSPRVLERDLGKMEPDTDPVFLVRVNFGTPEEVAELVEDALRTKQVSIDISGTKASTRRAFGRAFSERGIGMSEVTR